MSRAPRLTVRVRISPKGVAALRARIAELELLLAEKQGEVRLLREALWKYERPTKG